jgi:hypothetical protein
MKSLSGRLVMSTLLGVFAPVESLTVGASRNPRLLLRARISDSSDTSPLQTTSSVFVESEEVCDGDDG